MPHNARPVHEVKASTFRVLGHPARVRILELLRDGERSVGSLQAELELDSSGASQHLAALRRIGFVTSRREGTSVYYSRRRRAHLRSARGRAGDHRPAARDAAVPPARARSRVTAALLLAAVGTTALGTVSAAPPLALRRASPCRPRVRRSSRSPASGRSRRVRPLGSAFTGAFEPALRRRPALRLLPRHARRDRRALAPLRVRYLDPGRAGRTRRRPHRRFRAHARRASSAPATR